MDCNDNILPLKNHLRAMTRVDANGLIGIAFVAVTGHNEPALRCGAENGWMKFEDFLYACIGVDNCGKPAIRVKYIDSCEPAIGCDTNNNMSTFLNEIFAYDSTTKTYALVANQST